MSKLFVSLFVVSVVALATGCPPKSPAVPADGGERCDASAAVVAPAVVVTPDAAVAPAVDAK